MQLIEYRDEERSRQIITIIVPDADADRVKLDDLDRRFVFGPIDPGPMYIPYTLFALEILARRLGQQKESDNDIQR